jgi:cholesterol transport system auxiliary component
VEGLSATSQGLQSAIELGGTLRAFHVDYASAQAEAVIQYDATLITTAGRRIIASKRFEARQPLASVEASAAIAALGVAANQLAGELIDWTIQQSSRD